MASQNERLWKSSVDAADMQDDSNKILFTFSHFKVIIEDSFYLENNTIK